MLQNLSPTQSLKVRFLHGLLEPLEATNLREGQKYEINIKPLAIGETWEELASHSFTKDWDNPADALYDNWQQYYGVPKR
jgi:predicted DNA-binding antitoxin AbrB/MazE fold protein